MDKFVVKGNRPMPSSSKSSSYSKKKVIKQAKLTDLKGVVVGERTSDLVRPGRSGLPYQRQSRLFELKGVVVLEKLYEYKDALLDPKLDSDEKIKILNELIEKQPSTEIIQSSKIGKVIRKLAEDTSEENKEISDKASELYDKWKTMIERRVELSLAKSSDTKRAELEVQYDQETQRKREKSIQFFREAFLASGSSKNIFPRQEKLLRSVEQYVFDQVSRKLLNHRYNRTIRKIVFSFRHNEESRQKLFVEKSFNVENFVREFVK